MLLEKCWWTYLQEKKEGIEPPSYEEALRMVNNFAKPENVEFSGYARPENPGNTRPENLGLPGYTRQDNIGLPNVPESMGAAGLNEQHESVTSLRN